MQSSNAARRRPVIDCHSDVMIDVYRRRKAGERAVITRRHAPAYTDGGIVAAVFTIGGDCAPLCPLGLDKTYQGALAMLDALHADIGESEGRFRIACTAAEVRSCVADGVFAIVLAIEGAMPVEGDLHKLEALHERGVRVVGLTWNTRNALAVGLESGEGGLTDLGTAGIALMNDLGIVVDLSHASPTTFWDVVATTRAPLFVSHANAKSVWDHPRNLDDAQLDAVTQSGGAVGVVFCPNFVSQPPATLDGVLPHLAHFRDRVGDAAIVIGADFIDYAAEEMNILAGESDLYDESSSRYPTGIETAASMQNLVSALPRLGFDASGVEKIASANFLRVLEQTQSLAMATAGR